MLARTPMTVITMTPNLAADSVAATTAYADKDVVGDHVTLSNVARGAGGIAVLQSVFLRSKAPTAIAYDLHIFDEEPASSYGANNSAYALADTDLMKKIATIEIAATDFNDSNTLNVTAFKYPIGIPLKCAAGSKSLYALLIARGAVTFAAAGDLEIDLGFLQ